MMQHRLGIQHHLLTGNMSLKVFLAWEIGFDNKDRLLFVFDDRIRYRRFLAATDGLRDWNVGARYPVRRSELEDHPAHRTIYCMGGI